MTLAVGIITGVLTGVASAALFWWWQAKLMRPKLLLCRTIAYYRLAQDKADRYQIKIMNGRRRPAVDLRVTVSIHLPGLLRHGSVEILLINKFESPFLDKAITYGIQPSHMPQDTQQCYLNYLPADLAGSIRSGEPVDLEEFSNSTKKPTCESTLLRWTHFQVQVASSEANMESNQLRRADSPQAKAASIRMFLKNQKIMKRKMLIGPETGYPVPSRLTHNVRLRRDRKAWPTSA